MWTTILPYILKFFKSKYLYIVLIVVAVCAIQLRITYLKNEVESKEYAIRTLQQINGTLISNIRSLDRELKAKDVAIDDVNAMYSDCRETSTKQIKELLEISSIMDDQSSTEKVTKEGSNEVSKTTYSKGIDFINNSLSSIK